MQAISLATGAEMRTRGPLGGPTVLCVNGGTRKIVPGTWSATNEWLVDRLAPRFPGTAFVEVRYAIKSWRRLDSCIADARAVLAMLPVDQRVVMLGFSMGGAVSLGVADDPRIDAVVALAPWIPQPPDEFAIPDLTGCRVAIIHGDIDGVPGIPGVRGRHSRRGAALLAAHGADVEWTALRAGLHGAAVRPMGRLVPLPRAAAWARATGDALARAGVR